MVDAVLWVDLRRFFEGHTLSGQPLVPAVNVRRDQCKDYIAPRWIALGVSALTDAQVRLSANVINAAASLVAPQR